MDVWIRAYPSYIKTIVIIKKKPKSFLSGQNDNQNVLFIFSKIKNGKPFD